MSYASVDELRSQLGGVDRASQLLKDPVYRAKQLHDLPPSKSVNRETFILEHCKGKRVLEFGASGPVHDAVVKIAASVYGVDREDGPGVVGYDLDAIVIGPQGFTQFQGTGSLPPHDVEFKPEIILCGEVIEHLSNPGWFLTRLKHQYAGVPVIVTVPNAFSAASQTWLKRGIENVNRDHVAWYSPMTLATLLNRAGYTCADLFYYGGDGPTAEGLVVVTE